jgi:CO dehydrogenase maturation factor
VSDQSRKGITVLETIREVAERMVLFDKCGAVINRITNEDADVRPRGVGVLARIAADYAHAENDILGRSIFDLKEDSPILIGAETALRNFSLL